MAVDTLVITALLERALAAKTTADECAVVYEAVAHHAALLRALPSSILAGEGPC